MLNRFLDAQSGGIYEQALGEISCGRKKSHWMWFVFPQLKGLGKSEAALFFGIADAKEAREYLDHPLLGPRLREITKALLEQKSSLDEIFGWPDNLKFISCMTLFDNVFPNDIFWEALQKFNNGRKDEKTLALLSGNFPVMSGKSLFLSLALFLSLGFLVPAITAQGAEKMTAVQQEAIKVIAGTARDRTSYLADQISKKQAAFVNLPKSSEKEHLAIEIRELRRQLKNVHAEFREKLIKEVLSPAAANRTIK